MTIARRIRFTNEATQTERESDVETVIQRFIQKMDAERGLRLTDGDVRDAREIVSTWRNSDQIDMAGMAWVYAQNPGYGKTTLAIQYLRYMAQTYTDFGAVMVVHNNETALRCQNEIGKKFAYSLIGFNPVDCPAGEQQYSYSKCARCQFNGDRRCRVKRNMEVQPEYPIIIITHARMLIYQAMRNELDAFKKWNGGQRELMICDESPILLSMFQVTLKLLATFVDDVIDIESETGETGLLDEARPAVNLLQQLIEQNIVRGTRSQKYIDGIDRCYSFSQRFIESWEKHYSGDHPELLYIMHTAIREGGLLSIQPRRYKHSDTTVNLHVGKLVLYDFSVYRSFILDANGNIDQFYQRPDFKVILPTSGRCESRRLTIYHDKRFPFSKDWVRRQMTENKERFLDSLEAEIRARLREASPILVTTYKRFGGIDLIGELKFRFKRDVDNKTVYFKYFDGGRGTNDYAPCRGHMILGYLNKGEETYKTIYTALTGERPDVFASDRPFFHFRDQKVEDVRRKDYLKDAYQEVYRTSLRQAGSTHVVKAWFYTRDESLPRVLHDNMPGSRMESFQSTMDYKSPAQTLEQKLIAYFSRMKPGTSVKGVDIQKQLGISHKQAFSRLMRNPQVKRKLVEFGFSKKGQSYLKEHRGAEQV